ncbi:hypothetical protein HJFPF1_09247 [Paramyrothecium foliicola]|nr:hypothetical protein HJFPF1_09247 [Paramyrothecium foliicola]
MASTRFSYWTMDGPQGVEESASKSLYQPMCRPASLRSSLSALSFYTLLRFAEYPNRFEELEAKNSAILTSIPVCAFDRRISICRLTMQPLPIVTTGAQLARILTSKVAPKAASTMAFQVLPAPAPVVPSVPGPIPAILGPTAAAIVSSVASVATTFSTRVKSLKPSSTFTTTPTPSISSLLPPAISATNATPPSSYATPAPYNDTEVAAPPETKSVWEVEGAPGTKFVIYGLFGLFFGAFILAILIDMKRRPADVKETFLSIGRFLRHCPKAMGSCICKNVCGCVRRRKADKSKPNLSLDRRFEHAAIIERLAAKIPASYSQNEEQKSSADGCSNTVVAERSSGGDDPQDAVVATEEKPEQSLPANSPEDAEQDEPELVAPQTPDIREHPLFSPFRPYRTHSVHGGSEIRAELEATPVELRRPASSRYSVAIGEKDEEESDKREPETIVEKDETDYRSWDQFEAELLAAVRSP